MKLPGWITRTGKAVAATAPVALRDGVGLTGLAAVVYGVSRFSEPAAWIIGGLLMVFVAYGTARKKGA